MTRTALVHPDTAKLGPDEQKKGTYVYTPFEVAAYLRGEELSPEDEDIVRNHYASLGQPVPSNTPQTKPALAERSTGMPAAFAAPYGQDKPTGKLLRKKEVVPAFNDPLNSLREIANLAASSLPDKEAYALLCKLADRFDMFIE